MPLGAILVFLYKVLFYIISSKLVTAILSIIELPEYMMHSFLQILSRERKILNSAKGGTLGIRESLENVATYLSCYRMKVIKELQLVKSTLEIEIISYTRTVILRCVFLWVCQFSRAIVANHH